MTEDDVKARFEKENIEIFFMTLFPNSFEKDALSCISHEVLRLTRLLSPALKVSFDEDILLQEKLREHSSCTSCTKKTLLIRCKDHLGTYYLPAMLASEPIRKSYNLEQFDQYKALMLSVAIKLIFMGSTQGLIKRACDEIRLYAEGKRENLTPYLPRLNKVGNRYLQSLISDFETARDDLPNSDLSKKLTKAIDAQLAHYHTPLSNCAEGKQGIEKSGGTREFTSKHTMVETIYEDAELEDENNIEVKVLASQKKATEKYQEEENIGNTKEFVVVTIKEASSEHTLSHYGAQALQAKAILDHIIQNKISASCSINQATEFEIQQLLAYCENHYYSSTEDQCPVAKCLMIMLFLGDNFPQVFNTKFSIKNRNNTLTRKHAIPSQNQRPEVALYLPHVSKSFDITFPYSLQNATLLQRVTKEDLVGALSTINKQHHTHLTLNKISGFLSHYHKQIGIDPVLTQLISDPDVQKLPALSYTHINIEDLIDTFNNFVDYLYSTAPTLSISRPTISVKKASKKQPVDSNQKIGSALYVSEEILSSLMSKLIERLNKSAANKNYWFTEDHHDLITSYTQMVLGLSSGYRPVTGWLGKKSDLNLFSGEYYIADKDSLAIGSGRVVIVPPLTLKIIKQYLEFVSQAAHYFKNTNSQLSKRYQKILNSREHLFFYRNTQDPEKSFDESTPDTIILQFDYFPLPPNWHRHQLRTLLHKHNVTPDLIDAWMGHTGISQTAFSQFSSIGIEDLRGISNHTEDLLLRIGVKEVAYV